MDIRRTATAAVAAIAMMIAVCGTARAIEAGLQSRNYGTIKLVSYQVPTDCAKSIKSDAIVQHMSDYLALNADGFISFDTANELPFLTVKTDCLLLTDTRGEGRDIGYALSIVVQFYRPFYEDITYVHASTWTDSDLLYIPAENLSQATFNEMLDPLLDRFVLLWLDEHKKAGGTDNVR